MPQRGLVLALGKVWTRQCLQFLLFPISYNSTPGIEFEGKIGYGKRNTKGGLQEVEGWGCGEEQFQRTAGESRGGWLEMQRGFRGKILGEVSTPSHLTSLTPSFVPPTCTLETALLKVTIEHCVPVSTVRAQSLSHRPSSSAPNSGEHSHFLETRALFGFPLQAPLSACVSFSMGLQFPTSPRAPPGSGHGS